MNASELRAAVDGYPWYHTFDLGNGVVTKGMFDHRGLEDRHLIPPDLSGKRCLDVGTMDGYWAFAMERRGAAEVVALDLEDPDALDWPIRVKARTVKTVDETKGERFALARSALGSQVQRELRSVYDIDTDLGLFDFVFCGDLLVHLKNPVKAIERLRAVARDTVVVGTPVEEWFPYRRKPLARLEGVDEFAWWTPNMAGLLQMMRAAGFERLEPGRPFNLRTTTGGKWKGRRGVVRAVVSG
ncbi:MAG: class I SAM-dependent methyltransferase [Acidimicrobiales bacterium]